MSYRAKDYAGAFLFAATAVSTMAWTSLAKQSNMMRRMSSSLAGSATALNHIVQPTKSPVAPIAPRKSGEGAYFGINPLDIEEFRGRKPMNPHIYREDPYFWLRDETRKNKEVLAYLDAENKYCEDALVHLKGLREELYSEILSHLKETDEEVPHRHGDYLYYTKTKEGLSYPIHCRKLLSDDKEQIVIDENKLAEGQEYSDMNMYCPSPSHNLIAYTVDNSGYETYQLNIVTDISTGQLAADKIDEVDGPVVWGADDSTIFYLVMDEEHRPFKVFLHVLGTSQSEDICIFEESDTMFWVGISKSADEKYIFINTESKETSETLVLNLDGVKGGQQHIEAALRLVFVRNREFGVRYNIEHHEGLFYMVSNMNGAKNNKLSCCPSSVFFSSAAEESKSSSTVEWSDVHPYNSSRQIDEILPFKNHIAVIGREEGISQIWIMRKTQDGHCSAMEKVTFPETLYSVEFGDNFVYDCSKLRIVYSSFLTPNQIIEFDMETKEMTLLKQTEVPGYDKAYYESKRMVAIARNGTEIPMSVVYNKQVLNSENAITHKPVLLYGYGSYGACIDPGFDFKKLSLLDRGVVYVIAHIRGGGEMGKAWYEDYGKYFTKLNTFHDFIDCAKWLVNNNVTKRDNLAIVGRSAGGLLIGAVCNMEPTLFKAAVADVPFVDVLNSMSDPTIPLTVTEWEEWGNPNEKDYFDYMMKYSPYDNVSPQDYPSMLVTAGLNDPRVAYWEPAKWVSKLRYTKTDLNPLLLKTDMSSGHFSASDRYKYIKETALEYAFILDQIDATRKL